MHTYQVRVMAWLRSRFGEEVATNRAERAARVVEEAIELAQAEGVPLFQIHAITFGVYSRPEGHAPQEAAGVMVTLLAWEGATGFDLETLLQVELARIELLSVDHFRLKHEEKAQAGTAMHGTLPSDFGLGYNVYKCPACGHIYSDPRPCPECGRPM